MEDEMKLKPCPFCGGEATGETKRKPTGEEYDPSDPLVWYYRAYRIKCLKCGAKTKWYKCQKFRNEDRDPSDDGVWNDGGFKKAIKKWNRRAEEKAGKSEPTTRMPELYDSRATTITSSYEIELIEHYRKMNALHREEILDVARAFART